MGARLTRRNLLRALAFAAGCLPPVVAGGLLRPPRLSAQAPAASGCQAQCCAFPWYPAAKRLLLAGGSYPRCRRHRLGFHNGLVSAARFAQSVLDQMAPAGLMRLTGAASEAQAWRALIPAYRPGQKIAIRRSTSTTRGATTCLADRRADRAGQCLDDHAGRGRSARRGPLGVRRRTPMPASFCDRRRDKRARFFATSGADAVATVNHADASLRVAFTNQSMVRERWLADLLFHASYLVNMPITKSMARTR